MSELKPKPVRASRSQVSDLMNVPQANIHGTVFGGIILQMADKAAAVCAMRHASKPCVTVAMDRVEFLVPIMMGDLVTVEAQVNYVGKTSIEVGVEIYAEMLTKGTRRHANSCLVTMVAIDEKGRPSPVPGLLLETPEEKARYKAAQERRKNRPKS